MDGTVSQWTPSGFAVNNGISYITQTNPNYVNGPSGGRGINVCTLDAQRQFVGCSLYGATGPNNVFPAADMHSPYVVALSPDGSVLYITNDNSRNVWSCSVSGTTLSNCSIQQVIGISGSIVGGLALNAAGDILYVVQYQSIGEIYSCPVNGLTVSSCTSVVDQTATPVLGNPWGITIV